MKYIAIAASVLAFVGLAIAGTLTITTEPADDPRIAEAFGSILNLGRPATAVEVQGAVEVWIKGQTQDYEKRKNMAAFSPPPLTLGSPIELPPPIEGRAVKATPTPKPKKK
jgi:hypothetical protein